MKKMMGAALLCSALTGCAGMNSDFDCNKTATDQCLTTGEANKLAAQGKSLDELNAGKTAKKPAGETLPALRNVAPVVNASRPVSVAATGTPATPLIAPRPLATAPAGTMLAGVIPRVSPRPVVPVTPVNTAGRVQVQRIPDATQRLWIAPWVDTDDNFHQPSVVEFVKNKSHWDESVRVIGEGGE
ncbi:type IV conjugative transfer system lipoprotein TraV [Citrobacter freundii]|uniref:type IV conjugative transfer system lipoprotein TraV n=1 Tax=Enterobacteriaceae TaxID=543 RepID=UPI000CEEF3D5|nr:MULTISPECIES: type IV conjugative transfer system lipoprotein TraV [Enterobacteriaceae]ELS5435435.1 type IV conjugative transfer system lipoprotein TraV [Citrobacter freundii]EMF1615302.1 type IV conjugative transfer system lipoprotein TraV [Escherichia coli]MBA8330508.1 type IV conjugative transfer system lipoprotein TraV [Citrobacter freundii]MBA8335374.1 type IV conjugative transfer system lipoprotein TraV [Citrobacter freundii]MBA8564107.1 type IV conjugative transfer system lipoprotein